MNARRLGSRFIAWLIYLRTGRRFSDPTSGYRAFSGRALRYFAEHQPNEYPEPESLAWAVEKGFVVAEVPVKMRPRTTGRSSLGTGAWFMLKTSFAILFGRAP